MMAAQEFAIVIDERGELSFIYDDLLADVFDGEVEFQTTSRASHVEPYDGSGNFADPKYSTGSWWTADMRPIDGPVLGPFKTRQLALDAERDWLRQERGL